MNLESLKFPIGEFSMPEKLSNNQIENWINEITNLPTEIEKLTKDLTIKQLNLNYRPNGWKIKQVVHHLADSHINSFIRFKLTLTENIPTIKPYSEHLWAELIDGNSDEIESSIHVLKGIHHRWSVLLKSLTTTQLNRKYYHPDNKKEYTLTEAIGLYAWHGKHHLEHINQALKHNGDFEI
jgi:hypothetical protein